MLGDAVEQALSIAGFTQDRVERWLGKPCHCQERRERLNSLHSWAKEILRGNLRASSLLSAIINSDEGVQ